MQPQDVGPSAWVALFCCGIDAKSHHSDHEIAQKFIQFSEVIAEMTVTRQKWGKTMATRLNRWFQQKAQGSGHVSELCHKGQVQ